MTAPYDGWLDDLEPTDWERQQVAEVLDEIADDPGGYDLDDGPWHDQDGIPGLDDAFAALDRSHQLDATRIGEDIVAQLDRRPSAEDVLQRDLARIEQGTFTDAARPGYDPGVRANACGPLDDFGRCGAAYHARTCHQNVEAAAATGDATAATAWRETMFGYTLDPALLGYELATPGDGDDWQADALLAPLGGQDAAVRQAVLAMLGGEGRAGQPRPVMPSRQPLPKVSGLRQNLGL